jgi:hypothetical protein
LGLGFRVQGLECRVQFRISPQKPGTRVSGVLDTGFECVGGGVRDHHARQTLSRSVHGSDSEEANQSDHFWLDGLIWAV